METSLPSLMFLSSFSHSHLRFNFKVSKGVAFPVGALCRYVRPVLGSCLQTGVELWGPVCRQVRNSGSPSPGSTSSWKMVQLCHVLLSPWLLSPSVHQASAGFGSQKDGQVSFPAVPWPLQSQLIKWWWKCCLSSASYVLSHRESAQTSLSAGFVATLASPFLCLLCSTHQVTAHMAEF